MTALAVLCAAYGTHLAYTGAALGWRGVGLAPRVHSLAAGRRVARHRLSSATLVPAGALGVVAAALGLAVFGGVLPALAVGAFATSFPLAAHTHRIEARRAKASESWPRLLDELRILTGAAGRSIPQALFDVGRRAPDDLQPAYAATHREWLLSTDFEHTIEVLKAALADATADTVCETLLVAYTVGGRDLDRRLETLVDDRIQDVQRRKDAQAKQAGVRFARRFVLVVPVGMVLAGMSVGSGRAAYATPFGQAAAAAAVGVVALCWIWAGHIMRLPDTDRVLA